MIVRTGEVSIPEGIIVPDLKLTVMPAYGVKVAGSLKGTDQMPVEYRANGGDWIVAGYFTTTPAQFTVTPATPGQPQSGHVRAIFVIKNVNYGNYSPEYPITVAP